MDTAWPNNSHISPSPIEQAWLHRVALPHRAASLRGDSASAARRSPATGDEHPSLLAGDEHCSYSSLRQPPVEFLRSPVEFPPGCDVDPAPVTVSSLPHSRSPLLQFIATAASAPARWPPATSLSPRHGSRRPATSREFIPFPVLDLLYFCSS
jgi:hypothetical protein